MLAGFRPSRKSLDNAQFMNQALKTLRAVQWSLLGSIVLYVAVGEMFGPRMSAMNAALSYLFSTLAVGIVGTILVVRRTLVLRAAARLALQPDEAVSLSHWQTGYLITYVLCEVLALFGLVLRFRGSGLQESLLFYAGGFVLLFFFRPRQPALEKNAT